MIYDQVRMAEGRKNLAALGERLRFIYHPSGYAHAPISRLVGTIEFRTLRAPRPRTRKSIFIYLYLCFVATADPRDSDRFGTARRKAVAVMRAEGLAVPRGIQCRGSKAMA